MGNVMMLEKAKMPKSPSGAMELNLAVVFMIHSPAICSGASGSVAGTAALELQRLRCSTLAATGEAPQRLGCRSNEQVGTDLFQLAECPESSNEYVDVWLMSHVVRMNTHVDRCLRYSSSAPSSARLPVIRPEWSTCPACSRPHLRKPVCPRVIGAGSMSVELLREHILKARA